MHGHRHVSEQRQPAGSDFTILASSSLTLGCRSGTDPSFWRVELGERMHASRVRVAFEGIEQDEDLGDDAAAELASVTSDVDVGGNSELDLTSDGALEIAIDDR